MKELVSIVGSGIKETIKKNDRILIGKKLIRKVVRAGEKNALYVKNKGKILYLSQVNIIQKV